jgi:hypothetical protein
VVAGVIGLAVVGNVAIGVRSYRQRRAREAALDSVLDSASLDDKAARLSVDAVEALAKEVTSKVRA